MKVLKKMGWFLVAMLPMLLFLAIQNAVVYVYMFVYASLTTAKGASAGRDFITIMYDGYYENPFWGIVSYQLTVILVFGIWYYFAYGRKKRPEETEKPDRKNILIIAFASILFQILIDGVLVLGDCLMPEIMQRYMEIMGSVSVMDTWPLLLSTVILPPLAEELVFRGIIFRIAGNVSTRFWAANCIQALAFGIVHMNLIQGIYAFFLGLILGYLYGKYRNIWICMMGHGLFNLTGDYYPDVFLQIFPEQFAIVVCVCLSTVSLVLLGICYRSLGKIKPLKEENVMNLTVRK